MFKKTTKEGKGRAAHYHIVYINGESGYVAYAKDHTHEIFWEPDIEEQTDEFGRVTNEEMSGRFVIAANHGHEHYLTEEEIGVDKKPKESDEEIVKTVITLHDEAEANEADAFKDAKEAEKFHEGDQWEDRVIQDLDAQNRAHLTINEIEPKIDVLSGHQRQNRTDIRYLPMEDGDSSIADILNVVSKNILEQAKFAYEETQTFEDQSIVGRGVFNFYVDYDSNIQGDIVIERYNWKEVKFGPHEKLDASDCEYVVKTKWYSKAKIKQMWPDKAKDVEEEFDFWVKGNMEVDKYQPKTNAYETALNKANFSDRVPEFINLARKDFRVVSLHRKEYRKVHVLVNVNDDFYYKADDWKTEDINAVSTLPGFAIVPRNIQKIRVTTIASRVLLDDEYPDYAIDDFHLIPVYAKKRGNKWWGKVKPAIDPQKEVNKRHSQAIDIVNKAAAYGWFYDSTTFKDSHAKNEFKKNAAKPGFVQEVRSMKNLPEKVEGSKFPLEVVEMEKLSTEKIREIMNVSPPLQGLDGTAISGIAKLEDKKSSLIGNEFLFDNLSLAKIKIGRMLVAYIQKLYTPERIMRIVDSRAKREQIQIDGEVYGLNLPEEYNQLPPEQQQQVYAMALQAYEQKRQMIMDMLAEADLSKYDVVVGESAYNPTTKRANFIIWAEMARNAIPVPPDLLVELSDLPEKEKVKKSIAQMLQAQAANEQAKRDTEIQKTLIAKGAENPGI